MSVISPKCVWIFSLLREMKISFEKKKPGAKVIVSYRK